MIFPDQRNQQHQRKNQAETKAQALGDSQLYGHSMRSSSHSGCDNVLRTKKQKIKQSRLIQNNYKVIQDNHNCPTMS